MEEAFHSDLKAAQMENQAKLHEKVIFRKCVHWRIASFLVTEKNECQVSFQEGTSFTGANKTYVLTTSVSLRQAHLVYAYFRASFTCHNISTVTSRIY